MKQTIVNINRIKLFTLGKIVGCVLLMTGTANALSVNEYLNQVKQQSLMYKGASEQASGADLQSHEASLLTTPHLFAEARQGYDGKLSSPPMIVYDKMESNAYQLGVQQQFSFGLQTKLYYDLTKTHFVNASFGPGIKNDYWDAAPTVELSLPLWQNGFGRSVRANKTLIEKQSVSQKYGALAQAEGALVQAEATYWRLAAAQETLKIQERALKSAQEIFNYVQRKQQRSLGDEADVLQAKALVESSKLQLQQTQNELNAAKRTFNLFLNKPSEDQVPELDSLNYKTLAEVKIPQQRPGAKAEILATEAQLDLAKANSVVAAERNKPVLDIYGKYAMRGRSDKYREANKDVADSGRDTLFVGLRLSVPLNFSAASDAKAGALRSQNAAELNKQYAKYAQEHEWYDLVEKMSESKQSLILAQSMEKAQKAKLDNEHKRLRQGRTTTYQVLMFEQEYSQAQMALVRSAAMIQSLESQIKLYNYIENESEK